MRTPCFPLLLLLFVLSAAGGAPPLSAEEPREFTAGEIEFFEKQIRPLLANRCYECHGGEEKKVKGGLRLDSRAAALAGGETGPAVVPGNPAESLLVDAINYGEFYEMPPKSKLPAEEIALLTRWVEMGAPWPREGADRPLAGAEDFNLAARRAEHWCWQPITPPELPAVNRNEWPRGRSDRFLLAELERVGLTPAPPAEPHERLRRLYFDLIGLPPTPEQVAAFTADPTEEAYARVVDELLDSPRFGERWGRHWLDLVRYAESRGHEFDYNIPGAWQYRDYVIRALNADVPYDQFLREHVAGDLLSEPRRHPEKGFNESILGTGFWHLGEWVHSPVDIRKDETDRFDNMIDVFTKTFLGLTVSCARCHDHKFDAVSQADYYALAGYLQSSTYRQARFETLEHNREVAARLRAFDRQADREMGAAVARELEQPFAAEEFPLPPALPPLSLPPLPEGYQPVADFTRPAATPWMQDGASFGPGPVEGGSWSAEGEGVGAVRPFGSAEFDLAFDSLRSAPDPLTEQSNYNKWNKPGRTLRTPTFELRGGVVYMLAEGTFLSYGVVDSHHMLHGPLHGGLLREQKAGEPGKPRWVAHDFRNYLGHNLHLEFTPKEGSPLRILQVVEGSPQAPPNPAAVELPPAAELRGRLRALVAAWGGGEENSPDSPLLAAAFEHRAAWLAPEAEQRLRALAADLRARRGEIAKEIRAESATAPAMWDGNAFDETLLIRGNNRTPGERVPRRLLTALDGRPTNAAGSGRLELAEELLRPENPLVARVMVNRVWHHLFGEGLVATPDNFGVLGEPPSHPQLLDDLALEFRRDRWSLKRLVRRLVLSSAYQMASRDDGRGAEVDPTNRLLHRARIRRLQGEAIRDALLAVSGRLDTSMEGASVPVHLTEFMQGRGRPPGGPLDGAGRRSIYISVRRNFLSPMMLAFDAPIPFTTVGRRNISNVPAQALILMNDPLVAQQANVWAKRTLREAEEFEPRVERMYLQAFARPPREAEREAARQFFTEQGARHGLSPEQAPREERVWTDFAHVLFNVKEFVFLY